MLNEISYIKKKSISQYRYIFKTFSYAEYTVLEMLEVNWKYLRCWLYVEWWGRWRCKKNIRI